MRPPNYSFLAGILICFSLPTVTPYCEEDAWCDECDLVSVGQPCNNFDRLPVYTCNNETKKVLYTPSKYFMCVDGEVIQFDCSHPNMPPAVFNQITRECVQEETHDNHVRRRRATTGSSQVNPGESGCVESRQCEAVWPGTTCNNAGLCECPKETVPSRTRDGTVCISAAIPPACPLPEAHNGNPNPATVLANPTTHPLNPGNYMPVLCNSLSSETHSSNGGDGSTWCVYPDGDQDVYIADTYNCISHPQVNNDLFSEYSDKVDACRRGAPEFATSKFSLLDEVPRTNCLASTSRCDQDHQCTLIGSQQTCCPTAAHICSANGGRLLLTKPPENYDRGFLIAGHKSVTRYYYDIDQGRCVNFLYQGLGNYNNFLTKQDCESFCSKLVCENGNPLRIGEEWQRCETNADCPSSHSCQGSHKVCCPTAQSLCTQPKRLGDCTSTVRRYWYNAATKTCEMFQFTGCQGNDNNFPTLVACQQKCRGINVEPKCQHGRAFRDRNGNFQQCSDKQNGPKCPVNFVCSYDGTTHGCCPSKAFTCSLNPDKGVQCGSGRSYRYYFNSNKQSCESFQYEGCDGNANNFLTSEDCQHYCGVGGCPNGGMPLRDEATNKPMSCSESKSCPSTHECLSIPVNGHVGSRCCPTKQHICSQPPQQGNHCSKISVSRFYFNIVTRECATFQYNGCNGNLNNFGTQTECNNFCSSAGCAVGEVAYKDVNTKKAYDCNNVLINSCPANFQCRFNSLTSGYVCCGSTSMDVCPDEERAFINSLDETVRECAINVPGSCPADFLCRFNAQRNRYYCCAPTTENVCPDGRALFRAKKTLLPIRCTLNNPNTCPDGYSCQSRSKNVLQGFCCSARNICKGDSEFLMDEKSKMPRICTPGAFISCPVGYRCHKQTPSSMSGFCCRGEINAISEGCPPGEYAYAKKKEIVACDPFNPENKGCPATFSCQYAVAFQRYQCCGKDPIEENEIEQEELGCPHSQVALVADDHPVVCTASGASCPTGYFCQFSDRNKQFQCCGHKAGCPGDTVAYLDLTGGAQECSIKLRNCPDGYSCQNSKAGKTICCTHMRITNKDRPIITSPDVDITNITTPSITIAPPMPTMSPSVTSSGNTGKSLCPPDTVLMNGECKVRGAVGSVCLLSSQCTSGAECVGQLCACGKKFREQEGRCIQVDMEETVTNEVVPQKNKCTVNQLKKNGLCYDKSSIGGACELPEQCTNGTTCSAKICKCAPGSSPYKDRCLNNVNICEAPKQPVISQEYTIIQCAKQKCPKPAACVYSKMIGSYVCCSMARSVATAPAPIPAGRFVQGGRVVAAPKQSKYTCPDGGQPMLFPQNNMPLVCNPVKGCPQGYTCTNKMCCPNGRVKRTEPCPRGYLKVEFDGGSMCTAIKRSFG
uniref:BPTI/Kunitz inhibitor domain-containing protein n=1 Tax=Caenorhabditis japonica TaxID=281687 RepID=A0A8R1DIZ4_CAEJA